MGRSTLKKYTVVGFFLDNDQPYVAHVATRDKSLAIDAARRQASSDVAIVEAFEGHHMGILGNDEIFR